MYEILLHKSKEAMNYLTALVLEPSSGAML